MAIPNPLEKYPTTWDQGATGASWCYSTARAIQIMQAQSKPVLKWVDSIQKPNRKQRRAAKRRNQNNV